MASNTTNLNLIKPAGTDKVRIDQINQNMDILDAKIGAVGNTSLQDQITAINNKLAYSTASASKNGTIWNGTSGGIALYKWGRVCVIKLSGVVLTSNNARTTFASVPDAYKPVFETSFRSDGADGTLFILTTGGDLKVNAQAGATYYAYGIYITAS